MPNMDPAHRIWEFNGGPPNSKFNKWPRHHMYQLILSAPDYDHEISQGMRDMHKHLEGYVHSTPVGQMTWNHETGELNQIQVHPKYQRTGLATAMWKKAHDLSKEHGVVAPVHSGIRTESGTAWAKSTGDPVPPVASGVCRDCSKLRDTNGECGCEGVYLHFFG